MMPGKKSPLKKPSPAPAKPQKYPAPAAPANPFAPKKTKTM